jgi:hypothetical protein
MENTLKSLSYIQCISRLNGIVQNNNIGNSGRALKSENQVPRCDSLEEGMQASTQWLSSDDKNALSTDSVVH